MSGASPILAASGRADAGDSEADDSERDLGAALHEVSNGLTVILGWLEQARALSNGGELEQSLDMALARARRARRIARRAVGADDGLRAPAEPLVEIVNECAGGLAPEAGKHKLTIETEVDDGAAKLFVEAGERLLQILTNLVLNALDVTPAGGVVRVSAMLGGESATARFLVTDGGPGIPAAERARVFARGYSGRAGGAGIGLAHSLRVASEEGGRLELLPFESGKGAAFELVWPTAPVVSGQSPHTVRAASLRGLSIAVVDDDSSIVELLDMVLSARGASVATFSRHAELEQALSQSSFDVVLLDASPYGAGLGEALALLKKAHPELDLVLISGAMDPGVTVDRLGVTWIRKPFDTEEVIEVVRVVRAKTRAGR